ncbi:MAG TPA: flagellar motor protein MotB [Vicinamibacterales bacterium]|nr:flagellar motor protein MotB [Vicinamibacterales bacterium]
MPAPKQHDIIIVKKKRGGHAGHHGGAWKVAYADFVTAMMAFFLVMWIIGQSHIVRSAVAGYFRDPGIFNYEKSNGVMEGEKVGIAPQAPVSVHEIDPKLSEADRLALQKAGDRIRQALEKMPEFKDLKDQIEIQMTNEGLRIQMIDSSKMGFFDTGSAVVNAEGEKILVAIAQELGKLPNGVVIEGYTDSRQYSKGDTYTNWDLSADRANAARRVMERHGVDPSQVREVRGYADTNLRIPKNPLDPRNRRVSILVRYVGTTDAAPIPEMSKPIGGPETLNGRPAADAPVAKPTIAPSRPNLAPAKAGGAGSH